MKPLRDKFLSMLGLRASWGIVGKAPDADYLFYSTYNTSSGRYGKGNSLLTVATIDGLKLDDLRWEKTTSWDLGFDFSVFSHRLTGSFDVYHKKSSDVLAQIDLDPTTGWSSLYTNNAQTLNKGMELQLSAEILKARTRSQVGVSMDFTLAYNKNKILKLYHEPTSGWSALGSYHEGDPINSLYSFAFDHVETDEDGYQQLYWRAADGSTYCNDLYTTTFKVEDVKFSGSLDPKWSGSIMPVITWQGFSLGASFVWYAGHYFRADAQRWDTDISLSYEASVPRSYLDYWRKPESERSGVLGNGYMMYYMNVSIYDLKYCDQNVDHADYMKLRNIVLGYSFSRDICNKSGINQLRLRFQMNNVATWTRNKFDIDPEANNPVTGIEQNKTPRSYTMSLFVNF